MVYFRCPLFYYYMFLIVAFPCSLLASLPAPQGPMLGIPSDNSSMLLPGTGPSNSSNMPLMPSIPTTSLSPDNSSMLAMPGTSLASLPAPSAMPLPAPNLFTATQESAPQLAVSITTTTPPATTTPSTTNNLGTNVTTVPTGMRTAPPPTSLTHAPLTRTLSELLTDSSSVLSVYDKATFNLLRSGSLQQKATAGLRQHTDAGVTDSDFQQNACTAGALQVTPRSKFNLPRAATALSKVSGMSFTQQKKQCTLTDSLFDNSPLEKKYQTLIQQFKNCPTFIPIFTKFHILALSQLYQYLIGIYVSLTMTHIDSLDSYILLEQLYALNSKALIVQYLVSLVERQLNQALLGLFPTLPRAFLVHAGLSSLQCDNVSRLDLLFVNMEQVVLATFGTKSIIPTQWKTILSLLQNPSYQEQRNLIGANNLTPIATQLQTYLNSPDINSPSFPSFIQTLSPSQKSSLVDFLDVATAQSAYVQELEDCKGIVQMLHDKNYASFTEGQYTLLKKILSYYGLKKPLQEAITTVTSLQEKMNSNEPLSANISPEEFSFLKSLLAFALLHMHKNGIVATYHLIHMFEPTILPNKSELSSKDWDNFNFYKNNSFYFKIQQKTLAQSLTSSPDLLQFLSNTQQETFLYGVKSFIAANPSLTPNQLSVIQQLCTTVTTNAVSANDLVPEQRTLYKKIVLYMKSYVARDLLDTDCNRIFTDTFGADYIKVINDTPTPIKKILATLNTRERVIYYCWLQMLFEVAMYTTERCSREVAKFGCFSLYGTYIGERFFSGLTYPDYKVFLKLDRILNYNPKVTTQVLDSLSDAQKKVIIKSLSFLVTPESNNKKPVQAGVFTGIASELPDNPSLDNVAEAIPLPSTVNLPVLSDKVSAPEFNLVTLTPTESQFITTLLLKYEEVLSQTASAKTPSSQTKTKGLGLPSHILSKDEDLTTQTVLSVLHAEMHLTNGQNEMVTSLGMLFDFFAAYTTTLHVNPGDSISVINKEFSQFAGYANALAKQLENSSLASMNPQLFMYDKTTLEHLTFLPSLAQTIQSAALLFLPTQAIDMALLEHPVPARPIPSHNNNQVILQKDVPYNIPSLLLPNPDNPAVSFSPKFFFKDKNGKPFANGHNLIFPPFTSDTTTHQSVTHSQITWLTKTQILTTASGTPDYKYYATRPLEGEEGIYMNVPLLMTDQGNQKNVLARLYEQRIVPQPDWLNNPEGVIAMIRACLGDFVTGLTLDDTIFDPVINYIIRYTLVQNNNIPQDAGIPGKQKLSLDTLKSTLETYKERAQKDLIATYVDPTLSTPQGAAA